MNKIKRIITNRFHSKKLWNDIVFEWEDILCETLNLKLTSYNKLIENRFVRLFPFMFPFLKQNELTIIFEMNPCIQYRFNNYNHIIPWIIDFYLPEKLFLKFFKAYDKNPLVLISSKEAYDRLVSYAESNNIKHRLKHLPLSISDIYNNDAERFAKIYDIVQIGRPNELLQNFLQQLLEEFPNLKIVYRDNKGDGYKYYTNTGCCLGDMSNRNEYFRLLKSTKIGLYSTPSIDSSNNVTNGYNQVTPRFLEYISSGCHVISRFVDNSDTKFYDMCTMSHMVSSYHEFKSKVIHLLDTPYDKSRYDSYIQIHNTSYVARQLLKILDNEK